MWRLFTFLVIGFALTACASAVPPATPAEDVRGLVEVASDRFLAARQGGDANAFASLFTDAGIYMVPGILDAAGRNAVRELAQQMFASGPTRDFKHERREVDVAGDSGYEPGWFSETTRTHRMHGRHFILWKRGGDNVWRVHRYHYNFAGAEPID